MSQAEIVSATQKPSRPKPMANTATTLRTALSKGIVRFTFVKKDGTIRHALGTRNLAVATAHTGIAIPAPCGATNPNAFYDLEKLAWRSFIPSNVVSINTGSLIAIWLSTKVKKIKKFFKV